MTSPLTWHCQSNTHYFTDTIYLRLPLSRPQRKPGCFRVSDTIRVCTLQSYTRLSIACVIVSEQPRRYIYPVKPKFPYTSSEESTRTIRRTQKVPTNTWGRIVGLLLLSDHPRLTGSSNQRNPTLYHKWPLLQQMKRFRYWPWNKYYHSNLFIYFY